MTDAEFKEMREIVVAVEKLKCREIDIDAVLTKIWDARGYMVPAIMQELHDDMLRRGAEVMRKEISESIAAIQFATENTSSVSPRSTGIRKMVINEEPQDEVRILPGEQ